MILSSKVKYGSLLTAACDTTTGQHPCRGINLDHQALTHHHHQHQHHTNHHLIPTTINYRRCRRRRDAAVATAVAAVTTTTKYMSSPKPDMFPSIIKYASSQ